MDAVRKLETLTRKAESLANVANLLTTLVHELDIELEEMQLHLHGQMELPLPAPSAAPQQKMDART